MITVIRTKRLLSAVCKEFKELCTSKQVSDSVYLLTGFNPSLSLKLDELSSVWREYYLVKQSRFIHVSLLSTKKETRNFKVISTAHTSNYFSHDAYTTVK